MLDQNESIIKLLQDDIQSPIDYTLNYVRRQVQCNREYCQVEHTVSL